MALKRVIHNIPMLYVLCHLVSPLNFPHWASNWSKTSSHVIYDTFKRNGSDNKHSWKTVSSQTTGSKAGRAFRRRSPLTSDLSAALELLAVTAWRVSGRGVAERHVEGALHQRVHHGGTQLGVSGARRRVAGASQHTRGKKDKQIKEIKLTPSFNVRPRMKK